MTSETTYGWQLTFQYDLAGDQTAVTWWDGFNLAYAYDADGEMTSIQPSGAHSAISVLASYSYDDLGRRTGVTRGNNVTSAYGYDGVSRLTSLSHTMSGGNIQNQTYGLAYTASSQVKGVTLSNLAYEYSPSAASNTSTVNGLNELSTSGGATISYDARGNLSSNSVTDYSYDLLNRLQSTSGRSTTSTAYDPQDRLITLTAGGVTTQFAYIGPDVSTELNPSGGQIYRRYVPGPAEDETVVWYEGSDASNPRWLLEDHQGSVVAVTNTTGGAIGLNIYDEYGAPAAANLGRFQYTGQLWLPEIGVYDYKARLYSGALGRFMQTDPVGYKDGLNWYVYVHNDPINHADPTGNDEVDLFEPFRETNLFYHEAEIVGNNKSGWTYISKDGARGGGPYGRSIWVVKGGFPSLEAAIRYANSYKIVEKKYSHRYTEAFRHAASPEQDKANISAASAEAYLPYDFLRCNCGEAVGAGERAAGTSGYDWLHGSPNPKDAAAYEASPDGEKNGWSPVTMPSRGSGDDDQTHQAPPGDMQMPGNRCSFIRGYCL